MAQHVAVGYQAFVDDSPEEFGAVRNIAPDGVITVYVENAGELEIPGAAVASVGEQKVTFACAKLGREVRRAIGHAHDAEDPNR